MESRAGGRWTTGAGAAAGAGWGIVTGTLEGGVATLTVTCACIGATGAVGVVGIVGDGNRGGGGGTGPLVIVAAAPEGVGGYCGWGGGSAAAAGDGAGGASPGGVGAGTGLVLSPLPIDKALGNSSFRADGVDANNTEPASDPCNNKQTILPTNNHYQLKHTRTQIPMY